MNFQKCKVKKEQNRNWDQYIHWKAGLLRRISGEKGKLAAIKS